MSIPRIHCHSAFKHYEMFHNNCGSSYGNSIFNTTYNFNGGNICGGGFFGGLLGGLGMGLGAGLMNWLGGGMNMLGGMFGGGFNMFGGGFPMMNMFGGGFSMFGGGFPMMNMWGMGGAQNADGAGGKTKTKAKDNDNNKECEDKDREIIPKLQTKIEELKKKTVITQTEIDTLKAEIEKAKKETDDNHKVSDEKEYDNMLLNLASIKPTASAEDADDKSAVTSTRAEETESAIPEKPEATDNQPAKTVADGNLTNKKIAELTDDEFKSILKDPDKVKELLGNSNNNRLNKSNNPNTVKVPRNYRELVLAHKSGLKIQFCKNTSSEGNSKKSATITGDIESITRLNNEDQIYNVVVKDKGEYTLQFNFNKGNNTIEVITADDASIVYTDDDGNTVTKNLNKLSKGHEGDRYHIGDDWATREGDPLIR